MDLGDKEQRQEFLTGQAPAGAIRV